MLSRNYYQKIFTFFSDSVRISRKNTIFNDKKFNKRNSDKNKKPVKVDDIDINKILVSKKSHMVRKAHLNTLLGMIIMIALYHYVFGFLK